MQKAVMIAIRPRWVEKICRKEKTVEVRKTRPKCETPFKVYIYCTMPKNKHDNLVLTPFGYDVGSEGAYCNYTGNSNGKVIGEFVCDRIYDITPTSPHKYDCGWNVYEEHSRLTFDEFRNYLREKNGYAWHISDLVVYDEPRELSDFKHECNGVCVDTKKQIKCERITVDGFSCNGLKPITRPPMSWQFCVATEPRQTAD